MLDIKCILKNTLTLLACISKASFRLMRWPAPNAPPVQPVLMSQAFTLCLAILEWIWVDWATTTWNITVRCAETKLVKWRRWKAGIIRKLKWARTDTAKDGEGKGISTQSNKSNKGHMVHYRTLHLSQVQYSNVKINANRCPNCHTLCTAKQTINLPRVLSASNSAYLAGCQTMKGAPKHAEKVAVGSVTPTWRLFFKAWSAPCFVEIERKSLWKNVSAFNMHRTEACFRNQATFVPLCLKRARSFMVCGGKCSEHAMTPRLWGLIMTTFMSTCNEYLAIPLYF